MRANRLFAFCAVSAIAVAGCRSLRPIQEVAHSETEASNGIVLISHNRDDAGTDSTAEPTQAANGEQSPSATAEADRRGWTLAEFEQRALEIHPVTAIAAARIEAANGRWQQAGLPPNPKVGYHSTQIGNRETSGQQGAFISQRFITAGKLRLDQAVASWEVQESRFRFDIQRQRVLNEVRIRFYAALVAAQRLKLAAELVRVGDALAESSRKLFKAGQTSENNVLQAEIEAEAAGLLADNASNQHIEARQRLAAAVGLDDLDGSTLNGDLEAGFTKFDWEGSLAGILGQSPELDAARSRVDRAGVALERAEREWIPNVDAWVSTRHNTVNPKHDNVVNVQVGFPLPIFDRNQGNIRKAHADWVAAENAVRRIELDLRDRMAVAYRRYANARQQVDRYSQRILPRARKSLDFVKRGYDKRQVNYLTVLTTQRTYFNTSLSLLDAVWELRRATIAIEGRLLTKD